MMNLNNFVTSLAHQGSWVAYSIIFLIILCETGLVIMPFLPGDPFLFLCGSIATLPHSFFNVELLLILLSIAAFLGDSLNFEVGKYFGKSLTKLKLSKWVKPTYLRRTNDFFKRYGSSAVLLGRFTPIIRTLVPFTAGISKMPYHKFAFFNVCGGIAWVSLGILSGYFFGNIPLVKSHFELLMMAIIIISLLPILLIKLKKSTNSTTTHKTLKGNDLNEKK